MKCSGSGSCSLLCLTFLETLICNFVYNQAFFLLCYICYTGEFQSKSRTAPRADDHAHPLAITETKEQELLEFLALTPLIAKVA